jgi:glycosyltransferase involved in cell wall biosynthesis
MVKVSVIIPTYNEENYIKNCILALRNQDYKGEYEIIVSDGNSKDNTLKIAKKFADKVVVCEKRGIASQRNAGAKVANGKILIFVDADTIAMPNLISEFTKSLRRKNVIGVTCSILPFSMEVSHQLFFQIVNLFVKSTILTKKPQVLGACCGYKKYAFDKVNGFDEKFKTLEDFDLSERITKYGKIVFNNKTFAITSVRRIKKWGAIKSIRKYISNYFNYILKNKTFALKEYKPIRRI